MQYKYFATAILLQSIISVYGQAQNLRFSKSVPLPATVNSDYDETCVLYGSGNLWIVRTAHPDNTGGQQAGQDVWYTRLSESGSWDMPQNIGAPINNKLHNAVCGVAGNKLYLTNRYENGKMLPGISYSTLKDGGYGKPVNMEIEEFDFGMGYVSMYVTPNEKYLFISFADKESANASEDLYVSQRKNETTWARPVGMGTVINTAGLETAPIMLDDSLLFFTSDGHPGAGGGDIFMSRRLDDTYLNWSTPVNLGTAVNTSGFDAYFNLLPDGRAFYISGSSPDAPGDIYTTGILPPDYFISGTVLDAKTKQLIAGADVSLKTVDGNTTLLTAKTDDQGKFSIKTPENKRYYLVVHKANYMAADEVIEKSMLSEEIKYSYVAAIAPIEVGEKVRLNHVYFDYNKTELLPESFVELDLLADILQENPGMEIEIGGHTDNLGSQEYNQKLSEERVKSVVEYLSNKSIPRNRLTYKGYGETRPVASNDTEEDRKLNRRVEFTILKK